MTAKKSNLVTSKSLEKEDIDFTTLLEESKSYFQMDKTLSKGFLGGFWKKFNEKAKDIICHNEEIIDFMNGNSGEYTMKSILKRVIPWVVSALGLTALNPVALAIVIAALAYLSKIGFNAYCEV